MKKLYYLGFLTEKKIKNWLQTASIYILVYNYFNNIYVFMLVLRY